MSTGWRSAAGKAAGLCGAVLAGALLGPRPAAAQGDAFIPAYNTLASNLNRRVAIVGGTTLACKNPALGETVTGWDLYLMRDRVRGLMASGFLMPVKGSASGIPAVAEAFPAGLRYVNGVLAKPSLMDPIGDGQGRFTKVPGEYTASGTAIYADNFSDAPVLWIHFQELDAAIRSLRHTWAGSGWDTAGPNQRGGWAGFPRGSYDAELAQCVATYNAGSPVAGAGGPCAWFRAVGPHEGYTYDLVLNRQFASYRADNLNAGIPHAVGFYILGTVPGPSPGLQVTFRANGDNLATNEWRQWDACSESCATSVVSKVFGSLDMPEQGGDPGPGQWSWMGYQTDVRCVASWRFPDGDIHPPLVEDSDDDGLADVGCDCGNCPLEAKLAWKGGRADASIRIPLGISSGIGAAGLRVKAYMTEYQMNGITRQMYSLFTTVLCAWDNPAEGWGFLCVKRPSGAEVMMTTAGRNAGQAINAKVNYKAVRNGNIVELHFPGKAGMGDVMHNFILNYSSIWEALAVGMDVGTNRVYVYGNQYTWPGLTVNFSGDPPPEWCPIASVSGPGLLAIPAYSNGLIRNVEYRYTGLTNKIVYYQGSTGFRTFLNGAQIGDTRLVSDPANATVEIWTGITTNYGFRVARKEIRRESREPDTGRLLVRQTTVTDDGARPAQSNATVTAYQDFPWGAEIVAVTEGADTPEARTTTYGYGTNSAEANAWGRLAWQRDPEGGWTRHEYDAAGREAAVLTPFKSSGFDATNECRRTVRLYGGDPALAGLGFPAADLTATNDDWPRAEIQFAAGRETERTYWSLQGETQLVVRCAQAGARFDATDNVATVTRTVTTGAYRNRPAEIVNPDGTRSVFAYGSAGGLTVTEDSGAGPAGSVTSGVRRVTVWDGTERVSEESSTDIATGTLLSRTVNVRDGLGRILCASNTVTGTATVYQQGCCGPEDTLDPDGNRTLTVYDDLKRVYAAERNGVTVFNRYDVFGNAAEVRQSAAGLPDTVRTNESDAVGRQHRATDERGFATEWTYSTNAAGEPVVAVLNPDGSTHVETSYLDGRIKCATGTAVQAVFYDYGADDDGTFTIEYRGSDTNASEWIKTYADRLGRETKTIYSDGYGVETRYDRAGRAVNQSDGYTARLTEYNAIGEPEWSAVDMNSNGVVDRAGPDRVTRTAQGYGTIEGRAARKAETGVCDQDGSSAARVVSEQWQSLDGRTFWSIAFGRTSRVDVARNPAAAARTETATLPDGARTVSCYTNDLLKSVSRLATNGAVVSVIRYDHDALGRVACVTETAPGGQTRQTAVCYDAAGHVTNETVTADGVSRTTASEVDAMGRRVAVTRPDGGVVRAEYDPGGRCVARSGAGAVPVRYGYDEAGRLTRLETFRNGTNGAPDVIRWLYDERRGWLAGKVYADGTTNRFEHRGDGGLVRRTWARGVVTDYRYDAGGSLTNTSYSDGTPAVGFQLDRLGRVAQVSDAAGTRAIRYRDDGWVAAEDCPLAGMTLTNAYDRLGRRSGLTLLTAGGAGLASYAVNYGYDEAGRLAVVSNAAFAARYSFAADGAAVSRLSCTTGGVETLRADRQYDGFGQITNLAWTAGGQTVDRFAYQHNAVGQRTRRTDVDGSRWDYGYDGLDQVASASRIASNGAVASASVYGYDGIGNRRTMTADGRTTTYEANALNQYRRIVTGGGSESRFQGTLYVFNGMVDMGGGGQTAELRYDADGNVTNDGRFAYGWDAENRLITVANGSIVVSNTYDYLSRRVAKTVFTNSSIILQHSSFVYDGWILISELFTDHGSLTTNSYVWGLDLSGSLQGAGLGGLLCSFNHEPSTMNHFLSDANGNVTALVALDPNHQPLTMTHYSYDPFGNSIPPINHEPSTIPQNPFRFSTKYLDSETGLYYYGYRYYSPELGRWLNRDPMGEDGGENVYGFVGNNPLWRCDATGLASWNILGTAWDYTGGAIIHGVGWAATHPSGVVNLGRMAGGEVSSVLSGDAFDEANIQTTFAPGQCSFLVTINGVANTPDDAQRMRNLAEDDFGIAGVRVVNNTHFLGLGDTMQILGNELGLIDITARRAAKQIKAVHEWGNREHCPCIRVIVLAHSQGTMIFRRALPLLDGDIKKTIEYHGDGGETFIPSDAGLNSVDNTWNITGGAFFGMDPVPVIGTFANPLHLFGLPYLLQDGGVNIVHTPIDPATGKAVSGNNHRWSDFYEWRYVGQHE